MRNVISGNSQDGVLITKNQNMVEGNFIGADSTGTLAVPNDGNGIEVNSSSSNTIGGAAQPETRSLETAARAS